MSTTQSGATQSAAIGSDVIQFHVSIPLSLIGPLASALTAAAAALPPDPRIDSIVATMKELITMSQTTQGAVDHVATAVASMKTEVQTDVAGVATLVTDLKQQIADLKAAGSGATPAQIASLEASAADVETTVKALHDGLNPAPVVVPPVVIPPVVTPPAPVVFNGSDTPPNSVGGRNTSHLPGFDPTMPETA